MVIDNTKRIKRLKRLFYLISVVLVASGAVLLYLDEIGRTLLAGGVLIVWFLVFQSIDFQFINFNIGPDKIILRFYPAVKFGRKDYQTIEFSTNLLHEYLIEKSLFGMVKDLTLVVNTKRGIAEYPSVSMAALSKSEIKSIENKLHELLNL